MKILTPVLMFFFIYVSARADVVVMKDGTKHETDKVMKMAGAYFFKSGGVVLNVSENDVLRIDKSNSPQTPINQTNPALGNPANRERDSRAENIEFIRRCRVHLEIEAQKTRSDFKKTSVRALKMVEDIFQGTNPEDGTFEYLRGFLNNSLFWGSFSAEETKKLKAIIYEKNSAYNVFYNGFCLRKRENAFRRNKFNAELIAQQNQIRLAQRERARAINEANTRAMRDMVSDPNYRVPGDHGLLDSNQNFGAAEDGSWYGQNKNGQPKVIFMPGHGKEKSRYVTEDEYLRIKARADVINIRVVN